MPEALTNRDLADRALPNDGPVHEAVALAKLQSEVAATAAVNALQQFPLRRVMGYAGRFVANGCWIDFRGDPAAAKCAYHLAVLYLRGLIEGAKEH